jgi:molybdate transport system regulatory protein
MEDNRGGWSHNWSLKLRVSTEREGKAILDGDILELLDAIDRLRSISAAARHIHVSYRYAWRAVQAVNEAAEAPLVERTLGGARGGGARLTERGKQAVTVFRRLKDEMHNAAALILPCVLKTGSSGAVVHVAGRH